MQRQLLHKSMKIRRMIRRDVRSCLKAVRAMPIAGIAQQKLFTDLTEGSYYVVRGEPNAENAKKYNFTVQDTARQQNWNVPVFTLHSAIALAVLAVIAAGVIWLLVFLWGVLARRKARKAAEAQKEEKNEEDSNKKES